MRKQRPRSERQYPQQVLVRATVLVVLVGALIYTALTAATGLPGQRHYTIHADFADAKGLVKNSDVWIAGHRVGQVTGGTVHGNVATLDLQLKGSVERLPTDTTARLRYTTLLGALLVELTPGRATSTIPDGGHIDVSQTSSATQLADVLSALDAKRRPELRTTLRELGRGFVGRGQQLNEGIYRGASFVEHLTSVSSAVNARTGAARRLFPSMQRLSSASDPVRRDIARGLRPEANVLGAIAAERPSVEKLLTIAPAALSETRAGLRSTDPLLDQLHGLARAAHVAVAPAPATFRQLTALVVEARRPLRKLSPVLEHAQAAVPAALRLTRRIKPLIPRILEGVSNPTPALAKLDAHTCDFLTWARNWRSMLAFAPVGSPPPRETGEGPPTMLRVEVANAYIGQSFGGHRALNRYGTNAYPAPCAATTERLP